MSFIRLISAKILAIILSAFVIVCALTGYLIIKTSKTSSVLTVVIDAGHGGIDGGASGVVTGVRESDINLLIAKSLEKLFREKGYRVIMTRSSDEGLYGTTDKGFKKRDLLERVRIINSSGADFLLSIHLNVYSSKNRRGAQAFYKKGDESGKKLAEKIQARINGLGIVPRLYNALSGDYYLLNESKIPAVIVECGFLSSPEDEKLLLTESYRENIANAIFGGSLDGILA